MLSTTATFSTCATRRAAEFPTFAATTPASTRNSESATGTTTSIARILPTGKKKRIIFYYISDEKITILIRKYRN